MEALLSRRGGSSINLGACLPPLFPLPRMQIQAALIVVVRLPPRSLVRIRSGEAS